MSSDYEGFPMDQIRNDGDYYTAFADELDKIAASLADSAGKALGVGKKVGDHLAAHGTKYDLAGLGVLAAPSIHSMAKNVGRARAGEETHHLGHDAAEIGGLGMLAAPTLAKVIRGGH